MVAKYASLDQAPIPIIWVDKSGSIGYVNAQTCTEFGYSDEILIGQTLDFLILSLNVSNWTNEWWPILEDNRQISTLPAKCRHRKGLAFERNISVSKVEAASLSFAAFYLWPSFVDKTIAKTGESTEVLDSLAESICILDRSGLVHYANPALCSKFAISATDLIGHPLLDFLSPGKSQLKLLWETLQQDQPAETEFECRNHSGESLVLRMSVVPQDNGADESNQLLVSFVDITEQHKIAKALESQNTSYERLASNIPGFIYKFRMTPEGQFSFPYASQGCKEIFGVEPSTVVDDATPIVNTIHPADIPQFQESVMESARQLTPWNLEARLSTVENEWKWFHAASRPELQDNGALIWEGLVMDVTDRKQAEAALAEAKEAAEASAEARAEFLANMSHEIRTPLNAIIGLNRLALATDLSPIQYDYVKKALSSSEVLLRIINGILDFSKVESGKLTIEAIEFSLNSVLENVGNILESKAAEKGLELLIDSHLDECERLIGDPLRIEQILINLCGNAIKFTEQGEILIRVELIESSDTTVKLKLIVKDSGIGLSDKQQEKIFESFTQADSSTTRKYGGTGLGLAICKRMAELMNGEIGVSSELDQGSEFFFTGVFQWAPAPTNSADILPPRYQGKRVLFVDDNATSCQINEKLIASMGFQVTCVSSGNAAISELRSGRKPNPNTDYDLIVVDWDMPELDGVETVKAIRAEEDLGEIPVIMMTSAYGIDRFKSVIDQRIVDTLLNKPVIRPALVTAIDTIFGNPPPIDCKHSTHQGTQGANGGNSIAGTRILLVEDNEINQEIACTILESRDAHVTVANNGREAVENLFAADNKSHYDAVLMDLQMPEMDGFQATERIRQDPRFDQLPIIAMTAHAFESEKEKCRAVGMQDHVSKPIEPERLFSALANCIDSANIRSQEEPNLPLTAKQTNSAGPENSQKLAKLSTVDIAAAKRLLNNDESLLHKLLHKFASEQADTVNKIRKQIALGDHENAARSAHKLKGVAGNLHITKVFDTAQRLEQALVDETLDEIEELLNNVETEFGRFSGEIKCLGTIDGSLVSSEKTLDIPETFPQDKAIGLLEQLIGYLDSDNFKADECVTLLNGYLSESYDAELGHLGDQIMDLDFRTAAQTARQLHSQLSQTCPQLPS